MFWCNIRLDPIQWKIRSLSLTDFRVKLDEFGGNKIDTFFFFFIAPEKFKSLVQGCRFILHRFIRIGFFSRTVPYAFHALTEHL